VVAEEDAPASGFGDVRRLGEDPDEFTGILRTQRVEDARHDGKVEGHVALRLLLGAEERRDLARPLVRLGDHDPAGVVVIEDRAHALDELVRRRFALAVALLGFEEVRDGVEPDAVHSEIEPEPDDVDHRVLHRGVLEVEVGLVREEPVEEELPPHRVEGPVRFLGVDEDDADVGVRLVGVAPHVEVPVRPLRVLAGLLEPLVLVRGVVERKVDDDAHVALVRLRDEILELVEGPEFGEDALEVGNVVATVAKRRLVDRGEPQRVDPEPLQVVELREQALQVARPVAITVNERPHHDFVEDRSAIPPGIQGEAGKLDGGGEAHSAPSESGISIKRGACTSLGVVFNRLGTNPSVH
jgi:hypothetical protein